MTVLAELIAGRSSTPGLGAEVAARIAPWLEFTEAVLGRALESTPMAGLVPIDDIAYAVVALYLGMELLAHVDGDQSRAEALFETAHRIAALVGPFFSSPPSQSAPTDEEQASEPVS